MGFGGEPATIEVSYVADQRTFEDIGHHERQPETQTKPSSDMLQATSRKKHQSSGKKSSPRKLQQKNRDNLKNQRDEAFDQNSKQKRNEDSSKSTNRKKYPKMSPPDPEAEKLIGELLDYILSAINVTADIYVKDEPENGTLVFEIEGEDSGLIIGHRGETMRAIQFLLRLLVKEKLGRRVAFIIDIEGYRHRRYNKLMSKVQHSVRRVESTGVSEALDPMTAAERRFVHISLVDNPNISTSSEGAGEDRRVVIHPASLEKDSTGEEEYDG